MSEKCPGSGRTAAWCTDQTHVTCVPPVPAVAHSVWADGSGRWHVSVSRVHSMGVQQSVARRAIRDELSARGDLGSGYRVRVVFERAHTATGCNIWVEA